MKLDYDTLRALVPGLSLGPEELARRLTLAGVAVERIERTPEGAAVFEFEITANRPDLLCYHGVAREVAALVGLPAALPRPRPPESSRPASGAAEVVVENPAGCRRYVARILTGVRVGPSPPALARLVERSGLRPINNVVDVTNAVLLELNQPLHAFDLAQVTGRRIVVRRARPGERLVTLDGVDRALHPEDLVIADARVPLALAGVMGGQTSEIRAATSEVLIESAWFDPLAVRRTARRHGLRTEASHRFERGADPEVAAAAAARAAELLAELAGATVLAGAIDVVTVAHVRHRVSLRLSRLARVLGATLEQAEVVRLLSSLDLDVSPAAPGVLEVEIPGRRADLAREIDLIEEVGRLWGYDRIPSRLPPGTAPPEGRTRPQQRRRVAAECLRAAGFSEAVTLSMVDPARERLLDPGCEPVAIRNPLSERYAALRASLGPGLLEVAGHNLRHGDGEAMVFETSRVFLPGPAGKPAEPLRLGIVAARRRPDPADPEGCLRRVLGAVEGLAEALRLGPLAVTRPVGAHAPAVLGWAGEPWGTLRRLSPDLLERFDLEREAEVALAELDLERALAHAPAPVRYRPFSRFPPSERDVSFYVARATWADVNAALTDLAAREPLLVRHRPLGREHRSPDGRVAIAVRLVYAAMDRTLDAEEVEAAHARVRRALREDGRFELREG